MYEVLKLRNFVGLSLRRIQVIARQLLGGIQHLHSCGLSHNDIKPENVMFTKAGDARLIDFGSATAQSSAAISKPYVQSRFYRAPEVILGCEYSPAVDIWSIGCLLAELRLGLPLFAGGNAWDQCKRLTALLGAPPFWMVQFGRQSHSLFEVARNTGRRRGVLRMARDTSKGWSGFCIKLRSEKTWRALTRGEERDTSAWQQQYLSTTTLSRLLALHVPSPLSGQDHCERAIPTGERAQPLDKDSPGTVQVLLFCDLVVRMLQVDPMMRISAWQLLQHPFITGELQPCQEKRLIANAAKAGLVQSQIVQGARPRRRSQTSLSPLPSQQLLQWTPPEHSWWAEAVSAAQRATVRHSDSTMDSGRCMHPRLSNAGPAHTVWSSPGPVAASSAAGSTAGLATRRRRGSFSLGHSEGDLLHGVHSRSGAAALAPLKVYGFLPPSLLSDRSISDATPVRRSKSWKGTNGHSEADDSPPRRLRADQSCGAALGPEIGAAVAMRSLRARRSSLHVQPSAAHPITVPSSRARRFSLSDLVASLAPWTSTDDGPMLPASPASPASSADDDSASFCSLGYTSVPGTPL